MGDSQFPPRFPDVIYGAPCFTYRRLPEEGTPIQLTARQAVSGVTIQAPFGARIDGDLLDAVSQTPISVFAEVLLFDADGYFVTNVTMFNQPYSMATIPPRSFYMLARPFNTSNYLQPHVRSVRMRRDRENPPGGRHNRAEPMNATRRLTTPPSQRAVGHLAGIVLMNVAHARPARHLSEKL